MDIDKKIYKLTSAKNRVWGIYAQDMETGKKFTLNSDRIFESASTIKLQILLALFKKIGDEKISLHTPLKIASKQIGKGSGILQYFDLSKPITLYNIALLMIIVSDNSATNVLIDYLGKDYINKCIKSIGLANTRLLTEKVDFPANFKRAKTKMANTTAFDMAKTFIDLENFKLFDEKMTKKIIKILCEQEYNGKIPRLLPTWANLGVKRQKIIKIGNKTGTIVYERDNFLTYSSDVALIYPKRRRTIVMAIYMEGQGEKNHIFTSDNAANTTMSKIGLLLYNYFTQK